MGQFDRYSHIIVKMTKCRQDVHTSAREVCCGYMPQICAALDLSEACLNATLARAPDGILNDLVFNCFTGDYD